MKLYEAVQEAKIFGYPYIAIDKDGRIFCYKTKPSILNGIWSLVDVSGFGSFADTLYHSLGIFDYNIENCELCIFNINDLTL